MILIVGILNGAVSYIDSMVTNLIPITLYADKYMITSLGESMVQVLFEIIFGFGISLIILKLLKKGFYSYILWTEGDPDVEPINLVIRFIIAVVVALSFPVLYTWLAEITESLTNQLVKAIGISTNYNWQLWVDGISSLGLLTAIFGLIFVICYFILYFQFLMRGLEIMILRIGVPMACVGLLDNDNGVFNEYMKMFFKSMLTVMIQICLCKLAIGMMLNMKIFWGIACMILAIKTPSFLSQFIIPGGNSGFINNAYHSIRLLGMVKNMKG